MPKGKISMPDTANQVAWGKYLAHNLDCFSCHFPLILKRIIFLEPEKSEGYFAGGNKPLNLEGKVVLTPNLTPDPETGIGKMTGRAIYPSLENRTKRWNSCYAISDVSIRQTF